MLPYGFGLTFSLSHLNSTLPSKVFLYFSADRSDTSPLVSPLPITDPSEIDLEADPSEHIQCLICLETDDRKWRTLNFRFFVTREIWFIFLAVQLVITSLAYLVYLIDCYQQYWLRLIFDNELSFYYTCGALLFFALLGLSGYFITCYDRRVRSDLAQPCRELCLCCRQPGACADRHLPGTLCMWTDCSACFESCGTMATECGGCLGGAGEISCPCYL